MPMHGAGWKSGNKEVHNGKVRDLPAEPVDTAEADGSVPEQEPEPESTEEYPETA